MAEKKIPLRTCVGCRREFEKKRLIRIVKNKEGSVFVDFSGKANGRGAYFCGDPECLKKIKKGRILERSLGITVPDEVFSEIAEAAIANGK